MAKSTVYENGDGTVTDNMTGLMWLKDALCSPGGTWTDALIFCNNLADGQCELTDGSSAGDWRLPSLKELESLIDYEYHNRCLPDTAGTSQWTEGNPFSRVSSSYYWTSTTTSDITAHAWVVHFGVGFSCTASKPSSYQVWPVRGPN
jgi:hypothetical protein